MSENTNAAWEWQVAQALIDAEEDPQLARELCRIAREHFLPDRVLLNFIQHTGEVSAARFRRHAVHYASLPRLSKGAGV